MKKPVFPRIVGLLALYSIVFVILVMIQFSKQRGFTRQVGAFTISGHYAERDAAPPQSGEYFLSGDVTLVYGGMEFRLMDDGNGLSLIGQNGERTAASAQSMILTDTAAVFRLGEGTDITFVHYAAGNSTELRIYGAFSETVMGIEIPYRPLRSSHIREAGDGQFVIMYNGVDYSFGNSALDTERRFLVLGQEKPIASYGVLSELRPFTPENYTLLEAWDRQHYDETLGRWRSQAYQAWDRIISGSNDEALVISYVEEAIRRGSYSTAVGAIPVAFLNGNQRTYLSSVYLGRLDQALRSLVSIEQEKTRRITRLISEGSLGFLEESHVIEYLAVRGQGAAIDNAARLIRDTESVSRSPALLPGIIEGYTDWNQYRPGTENPFEPLIDPILTGLSTTISRIPGEAYIFVFYDDQADMVFNLRLGSALDRLEGSPDWEAWTGIGRSLVLSVLSLTDASLSVPLSLPVAEGERISAVRIYNLLAFGEYHPRAGILGAPANGLWAWTAATVSATQTNTLLDIAISFPVNETHYMLIRGVRPFSRIQLYDIDYRSDPQFERYDSSGWSYSASEQTLLVKMKHQSETEHIRVFYGEPVQAAAPVAAPPPAVQPDEETVETGT
ncbi:hypothetical protein FACS189444_2560 [Spirochaetia bacterium]|nr:hypothetical protein FACS189444_2560 [Spirochaetia bacterium]